MASKTNLVLFDMDGTLLDTRHDIARAANNARRELGLPALSVEEVVSAVGDGVNLFVSRVTFPEKDPRFQAARKVFLRHYAENVTGETRPYDGIVGMLEEMHQQSKIMGIVSNKPKALVDQLVTYFGWQKYFRTWLGGDSASRAKPAPDPLWMARSESGVDEDCPIVMVGDGHQDILAAKSVGGRAIWVSWGFNPEPTREYPSERADTPRDVLRLLAESR